MVKSISTAQKGYVWLHVCVLKYVCPYLCVYTCKYIYVVSISIYVDRYKQRERERERERESIPLRFLKRTWAPGSWPFMLSCRTLHLRLSSRMKGRFRSNSQAQTSTRERVEFWSSPGKTTLLGMPNMAIYRQAWLRHSSQCRASCGKFQAMQNSLVMPGL